MVLNRVFRTVLIDKIKVTSEVLKSEASSHLVREQVQDP